MPAARRVRRFQLIGLEGSFAGQTWTSAGDSCAIGSQPSNDLILDDSAVSRFHCEVRVQDGAVTIKDLESRNGTFVDGLRIVEANVRELRNHVQRCLALQQVLPVAEDELAVEDDATEDPNVPFTVARRRAILAFERAYLKSLMAQHRGNVAQAAQATGIHKVYLYRLLHRHGMMTE